MLQELFALLSHICIAGLFFSLPLPPEQDSTCSHSTCRGPAMGLLLILLGCHVICWLVAFKVEICVVAAGKQME